MITIAELQDIIRMADDDPGMADLLDRLHEYYLLKRPNPPPPISANDILNKIRVRAVASQPALLSSAHVTALGKIRAMTKYFSTR